MKGVPDFTSRVHVRLSIALQSGVRELDREMMRLCRKTSRTNPSQWRRYATGEFRRAVFVIIPIVQNELRNNTSGRKILERVSKSRRIDETKSPRLHLF